MHSVTGVEPVLTTVLLAKQPASPGYLGLPKRSQIATFLVVAPLNRDCGQCPGVPVRFWVGAPLSARDSKCYIADPVATRWYPDPMGGGTACQVG